MPKLFDTAGRTENLRFTAKSKTKAEIVVYGPIGDSWDGSGVSAKQFSDILKALPEGTKEIDLRLNSPGGDCFDGMTIYNRLKQHPAKVTVYIDGLAASMASIIMLAGDQVIMGEGALVMIHLPWTMTFGNRKDIEATTERLMDIEEQMVSLYAKKTKLSRPEIKSMLEKETWMDSAEAKEFGFIDSTMEESMPVAASALKSAKWINKAPVMRTDSSVAQEKIKEFKQKIDAVLARTKA